MSSPQVDERLSDRSGRYLDFDRVNTPYLQWQLDQFTAFIGRRVLEVGCGIGGILELLGDRELLVGMDLEEPVLEQARQKLATTGPQCTLLLADLLALEPDAMAKLKANRFDTVLCINVLEHIEDHAEAVRRMAGLLEPGGHLCLLVPAHPALYGEYDRLDGHYRRYRMRELREVLSNPELDLVKLRRFNSVGAAGWWVQYRLLQRTIHTMGQFGIMNAILPVVRGVESRIPPPFGLSLVAVCRKRQPG